MGIGLVSLVGAGPGDPGLITVRAMERLKACDVVVYDYLANPSLLEYCPPSAERIYVGKQAGAHTLSQDELNALLVRLGQEGKRVARLKGGDPYIFGRGGEEAELLQAAGVRWEVVPGISSGVAAPAYAGIPITHRDYASSVAFVTGHEDPTRDAGRINWAGLATGVDTLVFYMGIGNLPLISEQLIAHGRSGDTPVAVIRWGTHPQQATVTGTLLTIADAVHEAQLKPPAITIVGEVVKLRDTLRWFDNGPLWGKRIIVTRAREQASELSTRLRELGADPIEYPVIAFAQPESCDPLDDAITNLHRYDWIIFTSMNGVHFFMARLQALGQNISALAGIKIGAIGPATAAEVESYQLATTFMPTAFVAEAVIAQIGDVQGQRILLPRADLAREALVDGLQAKGAHVDNVVAYRTVLGDSAVDVAGLLRDHAIDAITFTSSSTVKNFWTKLEQAGLAAADIPRLLQNVTVAAIGPITAGTARELGLRVAIEAEQYTIDGLVHALVEQLQTPSELQKEYTRQ
ncbi:MAG: uroporphyrinogen-III C-methyltransferase [Herpetosiphonaceae bacterium]|nr:uroporphyrinogen-III C-methyltransferase [Herpetosiphonaceae bacterium]